MAGTRESRQDYRALYKSLNLRWTELCDFYLPLTEENSIWRYSRRPISKDPEQGWKIHVSATILTASRILESVGPLMQRRKILFKAPLSLKELSKINSGIYYGFSQVGKFLTVYPSNPKQAALLVRQLHPLTLKMAGPAVPFECRYLPDSCIYYRYGSFKHRELKRADGTRELAMQDPDGNMVADSRTDDMPPAWVKELFPSQPARADHQSPLKSTFRAFGALSQRGRGGVYQAIDIGSSPPRLCILKEGRSDGEVGLDGTDGFSRVRHEAKVLSLLRTAGVAVPQVYSTFTEEKAYYLVIEQIDGVDLEKWIGRRKRRLDLAKVLTFGFQLAQILSRIHAAGWVWRDCKLSNVVLTREGSLRPVDFEGACLIANPDPLPWGTPSFTPPEWDDDFRGYSRLPEDLYALGSILYLLVTGCLPLTPPLLPVQKLRPNVPPYLARLIESLLDHQPKRRPSALRVAERLRREIRSTARLEALPAQKGRLRRRASSGNR